MEKFVGIKKMENEDDIARRKKEAHEFVDGFMGRYYPSHKDQKIKEVVQKENNNNIINKKKTPKYEYAGIESMHMCPKCSTPILDKGECPNIKHNDEED